MADERYQWLDQEAAERLLRGEPVDAVDDHAREQAERLAQALAAARTLPLAGPAHAELPGEEAALVAFRKATAERGVVASPSAFVSPSAFASTAAELGGVRIKPVAAARQWGRSLRYGLAAAVAAVAVGGVAVAAGTGMLPFDDERPEPAGSVSAVDVPEPAVSGSPDDGFGSRTPSVPPPGEGTAPGASPSLTTPPATAGSGGTGGERDATPSPGRTADPSDRDGKNALAAQVKACQDFRAGRLDESSRRRLMESARTGESVMRFCDRVLADSASSGATREPSGGSSGDASGGKGGDGKGDDGSAGEGERAGTSSGAASGGKNRGDTRTGQQRGDTRTGDRGGEQRGDSRTTGRDKASGQVQGRAQGQAEEQAEEQAKDPAKNRV
ncbi:hypothetical protein ABZX98_03355 [Streptomyces sp. NPDC002992]|uniref:hypothetical protein n=1 Tax=Streptomyces sp. NPDC002992 TaxID=3154273 RepID=UPI0033A4B6A8